MSTKAHEQPAPREAEDVCRDLAAAMGLDRDALGRDPVGNRLEEMVVHMCQYGHAQDDPVREVMARLGDRWSSLLLLVLNTGTFRHATLRRVVSAISDEKAISQRMLTLRLRALERDGFVMRTTTPSVPPRVDYTLTPLGRELCARFADMLAWIEQKDAEINAARRRFAEREGED